MWSREQYGHIATEKKEAMKIYLYAFVIGHTAETVSRIREYTFPLEDKSW